MKIAGFNLKFFENFLNWSGISFKIFIKFQKIGDFLNRFLSVKDYTGHSMSEYHNKKIRKKKHRGTI